MIGNVGSVFPRERWLCAQEVLEVHVSVSTFLIGGGGVGGVWSPSGRASD